MSYFIRNCMLSYSTLLLLAGAPAWAHHDSEPATGPAAILEHSEQGDELILELMMPHSRAASNLLLLNFFSAEDGQTTQPYRVQAKFAPAETEEWSAPVTLENNGPVYSAPASGINRAGSWIVHIDVQLDETTQTEFMVTAEFY